MALKHDSSSGRYSLTCTVDWASVCKITPEHLIPGSTQIQNPRFPAGRCSWTDACRPIFKGISITVGWLHSFFHTTVASTLCNCVHAAVNTSSIAPRLPPQDASNAHNRSTGSSLAAPTTNFIPREGGECERMGFVRMYGKHESGFAPSFRFIIALRNICSCGAARLSYRLKVYLVTCPYRPPERCLDYSMHKPCCTALDNTSSIKGRMEASLLFFALQS